jgi:hypothetical protein
MKYCVLCFCFVLVIGVHDLVAQNLVSKQFGVQKVSSNIIYGISSNYLGTADTLKLDIYKPAGNSSINRPLLVLNHGGAWVGGDKSEASIVAMAKEFAQRGYVVASVNYRLGTHKANWALTPFQKDVNAGFHAVYIADSAEIFRANYRAMQDLKGAIRFLKARHSLDSTCSEAVFIGGESAGGFNALNVAFLDLNSEKPATCDSISDVPMPQSNLLDNYPGGKVTAVQLKRPNLGSVEGTLNLNAYDASVKGVINLFGAFLSEAVSNNWVQGTDTPIVYMTHQSCDGIVPCKAAVILSPMSINCNLGYTPFHTKYPIAYGSCALKTYFTSGTLKIKQLKTEIFACDDIIFPLTDCIRFAQNGSYHYTINIPQRCDSIARFIAGTALKNVQICNNSASIKKLNKSQILISPNPNAGSFQITGIDAQQIQKISITDALGKSIPFEMNNTGNLKLINPINQLIFVSITINNQTQVSRVMIVN